MDKQYFDFSEALAFMKVGLEVHNDELECSMHLADDYFYATLYDGPKLDLAYLNRLTILSNKWYLNE